LVQSIKHYHLPYQSGLLTIDSTFSSTAQDSRKNCTSTVFALTMADSVNHVPPILVSAEVLDLVVIQTVIAFRYWFQERVLLEIDDRFVPHHRIRFDVWWQGRFVLADDWYVGVSFDGQQS